MNQNKPPQSESYSTLIQQTKNKNERICLRPTAADCPLIHHVLSVWDRTGLALLQKSSGDPERTAGLLISTQQRECGVCSLITLHFKVQTAGEEKDSVCSGGRMEGVQGGQVNKASAAGNRPGNFHFSRLRPSDSLW